MRPWLFGGIGLHRIFDRAGRRLGLGLARQHRGHANRGDKPSAGEHLPAGRRQREHAVLAVAIFQSRNILCLPTVIGSPSGLSASSIARDFVSRCSGSLECMDFVSLARCPQSKRIHFWRLPQELKPGRSAA